MTLRDDLIAEEGRKPSAYQDSLGFWTIGVGHLIDDRKGGSLPDAIIDALLDHDIAEHRAQVARELPWVMSRSQACQDALTNMCFQLGLGGLLGFKSMLAALQAGDYDGAKAHALDSTWARQTPNRAARVVEGFVP